MSKKANEMPTFPVEQIAVDQLKPHPNNYQKHPPDQLEHLKQSVKEHGFYRNVVIAEDNTILAGHGIWEAIQALGYKTIPVIRLPIASDSVQALKVLTGDNELNHLAEQNDRELTELLKRIVNEDREAGLLGTGYDEQMLANLLMVTRSEREILDFDEAAHWVGMPEYDPTLKPPVLMISFDTPEARQQFLDELDQKQRTIVSGKNRNTWSMWWPPREREDLKSLKWEG